MDNRRFSKPSPVRPFKRFIQVGSNGVDPSKQFTRIVMKDSSSLDFHRGPSRPGASTNFGRYSSSMPQERMSAAVPTLNLAGPVVGTTKCTYRRGMLDSETGRVDRNALGMDT